MKKRTVSCWSVSWVILSILLLSTAGVAHSASDKAKPGPSQSKTTEAKQDKKLTQRLDMGPEDITVYYPEGWSAAPSANLYMILKVSAERRGQLDAVTRAKTPNILIFREHRKDHAEAVRRLKEIEAEVASPSTFLTIGGWPALQRRHLKPAPLPGQDPTGETSSGMVVQLTTAIAMDNLLVRLECLLEKEAPSEVADEIEAIGLSSAFKKKGNPEQIDREIQELRKAPRLGSLLLTPVPNKAGKSAGMVGASGQPTSSSPGVAASSADSAGAPVRVTNSGVRDSELSMAVSSNGQNVVIGSNNQYQFSTDAGQNWNTSLGIAGNDPSLAWGPSGTFYAANIATPSTGISSSANNGQNFAFLSNAYTCGQGGDPACGAAFPDQEHIAADRGNVAPGGDQIYSAWRHLNASGWGIVCSADSGNTWSTNGFFTAGDFPRVTVGQDGFTYAVYRNGQTIRVSKFNSCQTNQNPMVQVSDVQAIAGLTDVACPTPGLDRCNFRNTLSSPTIAVDDTNPNHVYVAYAVNTSPGGGGIQNCTNQSTCNENIVVQDSTDGGVTWNAGDPNRNVTISTGATARRFMPWVCGVGGVAYVSWYDRRGASPGGVAVSNNSLTDFYRGSASLDTAGNLRAGTEYQVNQPGTADAQCEAGFPIGSLGSWPAVVDRPGDSQSCSAPGLQLGGRCCVPAEINGVGQCLNPTAASSLQRCDFTANVCPGAEQCAGNRGSPKYGDYNGSVCAAGRFYTAWASATSPPNIIPASNNIDTFFSAFVVSAPQIQVPGDVHLGDFCAGSTQVKTLEVCNTGKADLSIDPIISSSPDFAVTTPSSGYPVVISPDFCFPFEVLLTPNNSGPLAGTLTIPSNDTVNPSVEVDVTGNGRECIPQIQVPGDVHLGGYCVGDIHTETLNVCNTGKENLTVNPIISSDPADFAVTTPSAGYPVVISPDFCFPFEVVHTPTGTGPLVGTLTIPSDDLMTPAVQVDVTGTGNAPDIRVTGSTDFGVTSAWQPAERTVAVCNIGQCDLSVLSATVDFACADFTLIDNPFPATLRGGACLDLPVQFTPTLPGSKTCELAVTSNDPDAPTVTRTLKARTPPAVSFHTGFAHPYGALNTVADAGPTATLAFRYPLGPSLAWDVRLGFANFNGSAGRSDTNLWTLGANIKYTLNPAAPVQVFLNGGPGLYHFDPGNLQFGLNVGVGLNVPITRIFSFEATYNYHHAFTSSPNMHFDLFQLGFVTSF